MVALVAARVARFVAPVASVASVALVARVALVALLAASPAFWAQAFRVLVSRFRTPCEEDAHVSLGLLGFLVLSLAILVVFL